MEAIVIYKSKYGSSKQYARWLSEALQCKAEELDSRNMDELLKYDVIIYVGGLYAGSVNGFSQISKRLSSMQNKQLVLCMVGSTNPVDQEKYQKVYQNSVPEQYRGIVIPFALRGDQLFSKMNTITRLMMEVPKTMTEKIPPQERTQENLDFLANFGKDVHFVDYDYIAPVIDHIQTLIESHK